MGATLVMVVILAVVLALILVLLAELYCSLLLRRRHLRKTDSATDNAASASHPRQHLPPPPAPRFRSIYTQGVLQAPSSFLLPAVVVGCDDEEDIVGPKKLHSVLEIQTQEPSASPRQVGALSSSSSSFISKPPQKANQEDTVEGREERLVYISNPIYETTPFQTPESSPSHLERNGSGSSEEDDEAEAAPPYTPPLTPMKKLPPAEAGGSASVSLSLRDARSLDTSGSDSRSVNNDPSSSSSASPCTSPSW
ncbi:hypothetical protein PIB30_006494 [Stylosanthes scabra]|uniref:Uncharacterized protein n=1 Tax=Stylosanthes scabra TaxID=79078 RepID=A0ABU6V6V3_9FABA|nr:hypothetical protein [Stylosanthes scabra]